MRRLSWASFVISILLLAGCAWAKLQGHKLRCQTVDSCSGSRNRRDSNEKDDWWSSFQDPELNSLVERSAKKPDAATPPC